MVEQCRYITCFLTKLHDIEASKLPVLTKDEEDKIFLALLNRVNLSTRGSRVEEGVSMDYDLIKKMYKERNFYKETILTLSELFEKKERELRLYLNQYKKEHFMLKSELISLFLEKQKKRSHQLISLVDEQMKELGKLKTLNRDLRKENSELKFEIERESYTADTLKKNNDLVVVHSSNTKRKMNISEIVEENESFIEHERELQKEMANCSDSLIINILPEVNSIQSSPEIRSMMSQNITKTSSMNSLSQKQSNDNSFNDTEEARKKIENDEISGDERAKSLFSPERQKEIMIEFEDECDANHRSLEVKGESSHATRNTTNITINPKGEPNNKHIEETYDFNVMLNDTDLLNLDYLNTSFNEDLLHLMENSQRDLERIRTNDTGADKKVNNRVSMIPRISKTNVTKYVIPDSLNGSQAKDEEEAKAAAIRFDTPKNTTSSSRSNSYGKKSTAVFSPPSSKGSRPSQPRSRSPSGASSTEKSPTNVKTSSIRKGSMYETSPSSKSHKKVNSASNTPRKFTLHSEKVEKNNLTPKSTLFKIRERSPKTEPSSKHASNLLASSKVVSKGTLQNKKNLSQGAKKNEEMQVNSKYNLSPRKTYEKKENSPNNKNKNTKDPAYYANKILSRSFVSTQKEDSVKAIKSSTSNKKIIQIDIDDDILAVPQDIKTPSFGTPVSSQPMTPEVTLKKYFSNV